MDEVAVRLVGLDLDARLPSMSTTEKARERLGLLRQADDSRALRRAPTAPNGASVARPTRRRGKEAHAGQGEGG
jgi:hypothetical protein